MPSRRPRTRGPTRATPRRRRARPGRGSARRLWSCGALAVADILLVRTGLVEVDVELGGFLGRRELVEVLDRGADRSGAAGTLEPLAERLTRRALAGELADDAHDRLRRPLGRELRRLLPERHLHVADLAAEEHLVARGGAAMGAALDPDEADVGDVVLAARVGAARDVDTHPADVRQAGVLERPPDVVGQTARLRHG